MIFDELVEDHVRHFAKKPIGALAKEDFEQVTGFHAPYEEYTDINALAKLTNLEEISLHENQITDVSPLAGLTQLRYLSLNDNQITDVSPLSGLTQLKVLGLDGNQITNFKPLTGLKDLKNLDISGNHIFGKLTYTDADMEMLIKALPDCRIR